MEMKKIMVMLLLLSLPLVSASLDIKKTAVADTIISELNNSAVFNFEITNNGAADSFKIYSLVGADFLPVNKFTIASKATVNVQRSIIVNDKIKSNPGTFNFVYKIEGEN